METLFTNSARSKILPIPELLPDDGTDSYFEGTMSRLIRSMKVKGITPYGSKHCVHTQHKLQLSMAAIALRREGHTITAEHIDPELDKIQKMPGRRTDITAYLWAIIYLLT